MNPHIVRRIAGVLVASQIRSGRSTSNPNSFLARPAIFAVADAGLFLLLFVLTALAVPATSPEVPLFRALLVAFLPYLPLFAVGSVLVAGVLFELTATTKFAGSDAVNWLPVTPGDYVLASSTAIAYTYSPALAFVLGPIAALGLVTGLAGSVGLVAFLGAVGLFEGAFLVEMVRSATQRMGGSAGGRGRVALVLRAAALLVLVLALQLAFNPVFLFDSLSGLATVNELSAYIPIFWSTHALVVWLAGEGSLALLFVAAQLVFAGLLLLIASELRARYWVVAVTETRFEGHEYASRHPWLSAFGLSRAEAAIVTKDFHGLGRRRELLPLLVVPFVILIVLILEGVGGPGSALRSPGEFVFVSWAGGFFALLLGTTAVGQERRAFQALYAAPVSGRNVFRAKVAAVLIPALIVSTAVSTAAAVAFGLAWTSALAELFVGGVAAVVVGLWGLVFAARYSDFQERPRPQYLRPAAMIEASLSGMGVLFAVLVPAAVALAATGDAAWGAGVAAAGVAVGFIAVGWHFSRTGFDRLFRELPF